jgi:hypothetical protein
VSNFKPRGVNNSFLKKFCLNFTALRRENCFSKFQLNSLSHLTIPVCFTSKPAVFRTFGSVGFEAIAALRDESAWSVGQAMSLDKIRTHSWLVNNKVGEIKTMSHKTL